jgi:hypothetical protein
MATSKTHVSGDTTAVQNLLRGFMLDPRTDPVARANARQLENLLTQRNTTTFMGQLAEHTRGLRFGVNVLLISEVELKGYLHPHKHMAQLLPVGGQFDPADGNDPRITGLREVFQETGNDKDVETSPLWPFRDDLYWLTQPVLDVHTMPSDVPGKPEPWWFLTLGLVVPLLVLAQLAKPLTGYWYHLMQIARVPDVSLSRAARHAQLACAET